MRSEEWFKNIFDRHYDPIRNYLYYLSGDIYWADDAVQEVFLLVWENRNRLDESRLPPYVFKVARNIFLKQKRHEAVHLKFEKQITDHPLGLSPEEELTTLEFDRHLQQSISGLPDTCRTVFLMSRMDELSNRQIAENLNVSLKAVEKQITRALKIIREKLENL
jgi:RNA polymerase sigma-70 factor (family 1)